MIHMYFNQLHHLIIYSRPHLLNHTNNKHYTNNGVKIKNMITKGKGEIEKSEQPREKPRTCRKLPDKLYHIQN